MGEYCSMSIFSFISACAYMRGNRVEIGSVCPFFNLMLYEVHTMYVYQKYTIYSKFFECVAIYYNIFAENG